MATDEQKALISNFMNITSSSHEEALFFLESHNFQLDSALHSFFENSTTQQPEPEQEQFAAAVPAPQPSVPYPVPAAVEKSKKSNKKKKTGTGGIRTLADLNDGSGSDSDDEDRPQEYFTGGEKSGMLVQDPSGGGGNDIDALFKEARQMGAEQGPLEHQPSSSSRSFTGTGRLLSGETVAAAPQQPPENVVHNIYFWNNGFTINDGPLRRFDDPANASFLESIRKSECPKELEPASRKTAVNVNLIRKPENYTEPVKQAATFQGMGRTLGSGSSTTPAPAISPSPVLSAPVVVDDSKPTTSIQLRLADGSRIVARFNTDHTVGDIRSFINNHSASSGQTVAANYTLQTVGFPPKPLTERSQTIEQAGLSNSVVIQKL